MAWIDGPEQFKPGCLMPAMHLTDRAERSRSRRIC